MEKFNAKNLAHAKALTREDLKSVKGGVVDDDFEEPGGGGPSVRRGVCSGSVGEWTYSSPVWYITCWNDIDTYCPTRSGYCYTS